MDGANPALNDSVVQALSRSIDTGEGGLKNVPSLLKRVIREEMWRYRVVERTGEVVKFDHFTDFVKTAPLEGLGANLKLLQRLCVDDVEALDLLDQVQQQQSEQGKRNDLVYQVHKVNEVQEDQERPSGNSSARVLRYLRKNFPELHQRVQDKELSLIEAAKLSGFRRPTAQVYLDDMQSAAQTLKRKLDADQIDDLIAELQKHRG